MCTAQPVFQVNVNNLEIHLCIKCLAEHHNTSQVRILNNNPVRGENCQCIVCE